MAAAMGKSFQRDKPRQWSTQRLATIGPYPNFDVSLDRKRVIATVDAGETKSDDTHLRVLAQRGRGVTTPEGKSRSGKVTTARTTSIPCREAGRRRSERRC